MNTLHKKQTHLKNIHITLNSTGQVLLDNFSCVIESGTTMSIMGKSGAGKSTLLRFITGVVDYKVFLCKGAIQCGDKSLDTLPPEKRKIGLMMQDYLLFPHMTVAQNLLFALPKWRYKNISTKKNYKTYRAEIIKSTLAEAQLDESIAKQYPQTLSGGQRARVALMRTLLSEPQLLLLDEPFSGLDKDMRENIRTFVFKEVKTRNVPALLVTHDIQDVPDKNLLYTVGS